MCVCFYIRDLIWLNLPCMVNFVVKTPSGLDHADDLSSFKMIQMK